LAVIKSLININNIYGNLNIKYVENKQACQLLIAKERQTKTSIYYAVNQETGQKYRIVPDLNPKSIRSLFKKLSKITNNNLKKKDRQNLCSIEQLIFKHLESDSEQNMQINLPNGSLMLDKASGKLLSTHKIDDQLFDQMKQVNISDISFCENQKNNDSQYTHSQSLDDFKWQLGFSEENQLINSDHINSDSYFKQVSWPNYGECKFEDEFIRLSSILCKKSENYHELMQHSKYNKKIINKFLNATLMTGNVVVSDDFEDKSHSSPKTNNRFLIGLKKIFKIH